MKRSSRQQSVGLRAGITFGLLNAICGSMGCDQSLGDYFVLPGFPGFEVGNVRIINASPDLGSVDVWNRLFPYWRDLSLGDLSEFAPINDGERNMRVVVAVRRMMRLPLPR